MDFQWHYPMGFMFAISGVIYYIYNIYIYIYMYTLIVYILHVYIYIYIYDISPRAPEGVEQHRRDADGGVGPGGSFLYVVQC